MNWKHNILWIAVGLAVCGAAPAEPTNAPPRTDYAFFKIIPDRNIFNPNRYAHHAGTSSNADEDAFALVGTMSYEKGTFAFFDGAKTNYQKVLERDGEMAGFKLAAIRPDGVTLLAGDKPMELKVGARMRRDAEAGWQVVEETEASPEESAGTAPTSAAADDAGMDQNDVLKKLMQKREQELK